MRIVPWCLDKTPDQTPDQAGAEVVPVEHVEDVAGWSSDHRELVVIDARTGEEVGLLLGLACSPYIR